MIDNELDSLIKTLQKLKKQGSISIAILFGSFLTGHFHNRSDIDLAIYLNTNDTNEVINVLDEINSSSHRDINILRLDDEDENPFVIQQALKGRHLVEPDIETLYKVSHLALHETESIRFRRGYEYR
ncbi:MAG: nucleotidyltransferase domain-containing protein [Thermodesulfovibrionales bacterium]|nr:nucleotidyltransferase domain-containing protein [Thermodesulfovibrionales bacterium]